MGRGARGNKKRDGWMGCFCFNFVYKEGKDLGVMFPASESRYIQNYIDVLGRAKDEIRNEAIGVIDR